MVIRQARLAHRLRNMYFEDFACDSAVPGDDWSIGVCGRAAVRPVRSVKPGGGVPHDPALADRRLCSRQFGNCTRQRESTWTDYSAQPAPSPRLNLLPRNVAAIKITPTNHILHWAVTPPCFSVHPWNRLSTLSSASAIISNPADALALALATDIFIQHGYSILLMCTTTPDLGQSFTTRPSLVTGFRPRWARIR